MADERRPRPVSGEIMTDEPAAATSQFVRPLGGDVVDAEYETLAEREHHPQPAKPASVISSQTAPPTGMDTLRRGNGDGPRAVAVRGGPLFWIFGIGLAAAAFWVSGGHALVRHASFMEARSPLQALRISGVTSRVDVKGARPVLFVDGEAANDGAVVSNLPPLDIAVTDHQGRITHYRLGTSSRPMAPGETFAFSSRLDVPKNGVKTVSVTFGE